MLWTVTLHFLSSFYHVSEIIISFKGLAKVRLCLVCLFVFLLKVRLRLCDIYGKEQDPPTEPLPFLIKEESV